MSARQLVGVLCVLFAGFAVLLLVQLINRDRRAIWPALALAALLMVILAITFGSGNAGKFWSH